MFFSLPSWAVALLIFAVVGGACVAGALAGRYLRRHTDALREPIGVLQGALLGVVGLILAFGLSLAVGRYEDRRAAVVGEANAIGTTYLRAQMLAEPQRSRVARPAPALHRPRDPGVARGSEQRCDEADDGRAVGAPASTLAARGTVGRPARRPRPRRASTSRRLNDMIDQQTRARRGAEQPRPGRGARARGHRRGGRRRAARALPRRCSAVGFVAASPLRPS